MRRRLYLQNVKKQFIMIFGAYALGWNGAVGSATDS